MSEGKTHELGTWLEQASIDGKVCWTSGKWLHIHTPLFGVEAEGLESALLAESLDLINDLVPAIIALAWVALGVLVREAGTQSLHDGLGGKVLAGNKLDSFDLALALLSNESGHLSIDGGNVTIIHGEGGWWRDGSL